MFKLITEVKRATAPRITIRSTGFISFNKSALDLLAGELVEIYYDEETKRLGFKTVDKATAYSRKVAKNGMSAKPMLQGKVDLDTTRRYLAEKEKEFVVIDLNKGEPVKRRMI